MTRPKCSLRLLLLTLVRRAGLLLVSSAMLALSLPMAALAPSSVVAAQLTTNTMEQVLAAAKQEGVIEFYAGASLSPAGAQKLAEAFNRTYGLNIRLIYTAGGNMAVDVGRLVSEAAVGVPPRWDLLAGLTEAHHGVLWLRKLHKPFDYRSLGVDARAIRYDGGTVAYAHQIVLPAYNKKFLSSQDVPTRWEDLLDPKWKGGKLGVHTATHHFARLAVGLWGEKKATEFMKALAKQKPMLGGPPEIFTRLLVGEILLAATLTDSSTTRAKRLGAPIVHAEGIEPLIAPEFQAGVPKNASHPSTGHVFAAFLATSPDAQKIWAEYMGQTSAFIPGTPTYNYLTGKQVLYMSEEQAADVDRLSMEYAKILGFR